MLLDIYKKYVHSRYQPPISKRMADSLPYTHIQVSKSHYLSRKYEQEYLLCILFGDSTNYSEVSRLYYEVSASSDSGDLLVSANNPYLYLENPFPTKYVEYWSAKKLNKIASIGDSSKVSSLLSKLSFLTCYTERNYPIEELLIGNYDLFIITKELLIKYEYLIKDYSKVIYV